MRPRSSGREPSKADADAAKAAADEQAWEAEKKRREEEQRAKEERNKLLSTGIQTADANMDGAPKFIAEQRARADELMRLRMKLEKAPKGSIKWIKRSLVLKAAEAKNELEKLSDVTIVDQNAKKANPTLKEKILPSLRVESAHKEKLRKKESSEDFSKTSKGKLYDYTVFKLDIPAQWKKFGGADLPFMSKVQGWDVWTKSMKTSELGYMELEEDGYTQLKAQRHIEKAVLPTLVGEFFPWLLDELKKPVVDEAGIKKRWASVSSALIDKAAAESTGYLEAQIKKRKDAKAANADFKVDSAINIARNTASIAASAGLTVATHGAYGPMGIIMIVRSGLAIADELIIQASDQAAIAKQITAQLDGYFKLMNEKREEALEKYRKDNFSGKEITPDQKSGLYNFGMQVVSDFFSTSLTPSVPNIKKRVDAHRHKITDMKDNYAELVKVQKSAERYKAKWKKGDAKAYVDGLSKDELNKLYKKKVNILDLTKKLNAGIEQADRFLALHVAEMQQLVEAIKAANKLQKEFDETVGMLEKKLPTWTPIAAKIVNMAVGAGLGFGDAVGATNVFCQAAGFTQSIIEGAEALDATKDLIKDSNELKAITKKLDSGLQQMRSKFKELEAAVA